jgi:hypothetical protein
MKKIILTAVFALGAVVATYAQSPVSFSVRAGLNINSLRSDGDELKDFGSKIGFNVGALVGYNFTDMFGLQSGLLLNTRGAKYDKDKMVIALSLYELQVPVFLTGTFAISDDFKVKANVGPTFGIGLSAKQSAEYDGKAEEGSPFDMYKKEEGADKSMAKRFDLGIAAGVGAEYKNIYLGVGYDLGVTDITNKFDGESDHKYIKTGSFTINLGYTF